jgi:hypothetical protein
VTGAVNVGVTIEDRGGFKMKIKGGEMKARW